MKLGYLSFAALCFSVGGLAQTAAPPKSAPLDPSPLTVSLAQPQSVTVLPANTEVMLEMNDTITTKGRRWSEGDNFNMTVTHDVMLGNYVIIPRGSKGVGRITWLTDKGAFGKSGKLEIDVEYVEVSGRRIQLTGNYRQEGEGNTVATVGGVVAAGIFAGFITGKSGRIPQGRELIARTKNDLPVVFAPQPSNQEPGSTVRPVKQ